MGRSFTAPFLVSWNVTKRCNLKCPHCYLDATELEGGHEATTAEAYSYIREIAGVNPKAMLILTGGEPLMRPDIYDLSRYASSHGLTVVVGTSGVMLDNRTVAALKASSVSGVGVSLDSVLPQRHDSFRGMPGAWDATIRGMETLRSNRLDFQLQFTVTRENRHEVAGIIELAEEAGAKAVNIFFLVCTGRGTQMTDLTATEYEQTLELLADASMQSKGPMMIRARCAPHILRIAEERRTRGSLKFLTSGCIAGRGYLRISPNGFVTPCPYIPVTESSPYLGDMPLREICANDPMLRSLAAPALKGRCGECEYDDICGGCRARALATTTDLMEEDDWCEYTPKKTEEILTMGEKEIVWEEAALENLNKIPVFVRPMVRKSVEKYAQSNGIERITPQVMEEVRGKMGK